MWCDVVQVKITGRKAWALFLFCSIRDDKPHVSHSSLKAHIAAQGTGENTNTRSYNAPEHNTNAGIAQGNIVGPVRITFKHTLTNEKRKMSRSVSTVSTQLVVSTWFREKYTIYVQLVTEAVPGRLLPFKTWYPLLPAALHRTTTDPQPAAKRLHLPLPHLSNTASLFHLTQNCPIRTPRRRAGATISAHVNMQHLQLHCCESPLKVAQLSRHINSDKSLSESAPALHVDNHGTLWKGEHEFDLGVWDNYQWSMRTKGGGRGADGWRAVSQNKHNVSSYPPLPLMGG